ncbi:hypothetical protein ACFY1P_20240 [Streptomyces sp. NPDC001407]|uniref:hypothetical protein n=1 Tax=Streptomyces sp. NPDC001407 TaxID=3364573 RepID=UPI00368E0BB3
MHQQTTAPEGGMQVISEALLTAYQHLGAEHQALATETRGTSAKERLGTLRRMKQSLADASIQLVQGLELVATVHGKQALGLSGQASQDADGKDYFSLPSLVDAGENLFGAQRHIAEAVRCLGKAYEPTQKYRALAVARRPQHMSTVFRGLRAAITALRTELTTRGQGDEAAECDTLTGLLDQLEPRVCRPVPAQTSGPTADDVTTAILADPTIARAAADALKQLTNT